MITALFSFFFLISSAFSCELISQYKSYYSLSGAATLAFRDLGLLKSSALKGISVFHPISSEEFKGEFLPGGVFLSQEKVKGLSGSVIFFDESRELKKILEQFPQIKAVEIKTRSLMPQEVLKKLEKDLTPFLKNCSFNKLHQGINSKLSELSSLIPKGQTYLFFLGAIRTGRLPEFLMVQDGVVKWMVLKKLIETYPSELPYVNWSSRILQSLPEHTYRVGLKDSGNSMEKKIEKDDQKKIINLTYPGSMIPGEGQVDAMIYLFKNFKN